MSDLTEAEVREAYLLTLEAKLRYKDRIEELEAALREIREAPICGDSQHRHTGACGTYRTGMALMRDIARRALEADANE